MRQKNKRNRRWICLAAGWALAIMLLSGSGLLNHFNFVVSDALFQHPNKPDERIVVLGIDDYALKKLGEWPWKRSVMAELLQILNGDVENRPAAIGIDVIYSGEMDKQMDADLVQAASAGNVAVSCMAEFGSRMVSAEDGSTYMDDFSALLTSVPFDALAKTAKVGHVNAMYDFDGVLRHHLWSIPRTDGTEVPSLPDQVYQMYCKYWQLPAGFVPKTNRQGFWWVDYSGAPGDYYSYSVADIFEGAYDPDFFKGKIVLIGLFDPGLADNFITAADRAHRMQGVEYLANVTSAILRNENKIFVPKMVQLLALAGICFGAGLLFFRLPLRRAILLYFVLLTGSTLGTWWLYQQDWITCPLWLLFGLTLIVIGGIAEHYYIAVKERYSIVHTFERYVDKAIMHELLKEDSEALGLGGKNVKVAVLFVDIRGFTSLSEKLPPEDVVTILNQYLTLTSHSIRNHEGTLDKFVGDCTMALWGAPLPCKDAVYKACQAALEMVNGGRELARALKESYGFDVQVGVGVHYGSAIVGNIGAPERMDYTAIGDTVNTAARLEANAPAGKIYISRIVADELADKAVVTSLGTKIALKGKSEGFEVLTLEKLIVEDEEVDGVSAAIK